MLNKEIRIAGFLLACAFAAVLAACGSDKFDASSGTTTAITPGPNQAIVMGTVNGDTSGSSSGVAGATVYVMGQESNKATADDNGNYTLIIDTSKSPVVTQKPSTAPVSVHAKIKKDSPKAAASTTNNYSVIAQSKSKLHGIKSEVTVSEGETKTNQSLTVVRVGSISGNAKLQGLNDPTGIIVYIPGTSFFALTDANGNYTISSVPPGIYPALRADKTGYRHGMLSDITVMANADTAVADMLLLLDTGASGSLVIGTGLPYVTSRDVTLNIGATPNATLMMISEDVNFIGAAWETVTTTKAYTFASDGVFVLYVKFADANSLVSAPYAASVLVDTTAPSVTSSTPADSKVNTNPEASVTITFSEPMDVGSLTDATITLDNGVACAVTYDAATDTATCTPSAQLKTNTTYTLSLSSGIKDVHGWSLAGKNISFTTALSWVSTIAGSAGVNDFADGTGAAARLNQPLGITNDGTNLYVMDFGNRIIRKMVISTGEVTTLAGSPGVSGWADGIGTAARFGTVFDAIVVGANLYVADSSNSTIRKVVISTGEVTTLAGSPGIPSYFDGIGAAAGFKYPRGITSDGTYLYMGDPPIIRKIVISTGEVTSLVPQYCCPWPISSIDYMSYMVTDGTNLYVTDPENHKIRKWVISTATLSELAGGFSGSADGIGLAAGFNMPRGIATDGTNLYVTDSFNYTIRKIVISTGEVTTIAGRARQAGSIDGPGIDGPGSGARFSKLTGITMVGRSLYVIDNATIRKIVL